MKYIGKIAILSTFGISLIIVKQKMLFYPLIRFSVYH